MGKIRHGQETLGGVKPYVPVFVGSTFNDMKLYRRAAQDALVQLETIVRGMEHFGSKPGTPVDECLRIVRSCKVYIGVFGMRYGSVPDGFDKSMTHLEYEEAQTAKLPSLIYVIDEDNQPVLPKYVEIGPGAQRLEQLKVELKKRHLVSLYTTPDDLKSRILHDLPQVMKEMGEEVSGELEAEQHQNEADLLREFALLPKVFSGRPLIIEFVTKGGFKAAFPEACRALGLEIGATVFDRVKFTKGGDERVFAERDHALTLCRLPKGTKIRARAVTAFGVYDRIDYLDEPVGTPEVETGLVLRQILETSPKQ